MTEDPTEHLSADELDVLRLEAAERRRARWAKKVYPVIDNAAQPRDEWDYLWGLPWPYEPADYGELQ